MYMRLGFAVAIHVNPDILLIDEVLAVGDEAFVHKCLDKISEFRRQQKTIVLVTHSLGLVEKMADEALWIHESKIQMRGDPEEGRRRLPRPRRRSSRSVLWRSRRTKSAGGAVRVARVTEAEHEENESEIEPSSAFAREKGRWGSREVEIHEVTLTRSRTDKPRSTSSRPGSR